MATSTTAREIEFMPWEDNEAPHGVAFSMRWVTTTKWRDAAGRRQYSKDDRQVERLAENLTVDDLLEIASSALRAALDAMEAPRG